jgi:two-component system, OmpR family, response regulator MprA
MATSAATLGNSVAPATTRVLVVEDADNVARLVRRGLVLEGFDVDVALDGQTALAMFRDRGSDLVILDLTLPGIDGLEVCRRIRAADAAGGQPETPVLMLTGRGAVRDRVAGLSAGADDYLIKPFALEELVARVHALLRRTQASAAPVDSLRYEDLSVDINARIVKRGQRTVHLTSREFDLLVALLRHQNHVLTQDQLLDRVWGEEFYGESNVLAVVIASLRRALEAGGEPRLVQTVRGVGYVLRDTP